MYFKYVRGKIGPTRVSWLRTYEALERAPCHAPFSEFYNLAIFVSVIEAR